MKKTKLILNNLAFYARHGLTEEEAKLGQRFRVDVELELNPEVQIDKDLPEETVNYVEVFEVVQKIFEAERFNLIETCAHAIASSLFKDFESINVVSVTVKNPSVPVDCICDYFAAEVTLCR